MKGNKEKLLIGGMVLVLFFFVFSACKKSSTAPNVSPDQTAISRMVVNDNTSFSSTIVDTSSVSFPKIVAGDTVKFWWRKINRDDRTINVVTYPADSTHALPWAIVTVTDMLSGRLMILFDSSGHTFVKSKPLSDQAVRKAMFVKKGKDEDDDRGWFLVGVSGLLVHSVPSTRIIEKVHLVIRRAGLVIKDITLMEPDITRIVPLDSLLTLVKGDSIRVTVTTADSTDSVFFHAMFCNLNNCRIHREEFEHHHEDSSSHDEEVGDELEEGMMEGRRNLAIDVLKHTSLDTIDGPYDSRIWGIHYRIKRMETR